MIDDWFQGGQPELINLLSQYDKQEIQQMLIIMTYWEEMVNVGIINIDDINDLANLSSEKQEAIKNFVSSKLKDVIERKSNGKGKQKEKL
jgi:hypothetical protein